MFLPHRPTAILITFVYKRELSFERREIATQLSRGAVEEARLTDETQGKATNHDLCGWTLSFAGEKLYLDLR